MNAIHHKSPYLSMLFVFFFLGFSLFTKAQVYPVQVIPQINPPYNVTLPSYTTTTSDKINVRLILTDIGANVDVRLKMIIKGQGLNIQSTDFVVGAAPINLTGGTPELISTIDLQPYFRLQNLVGIPPQVYNRALPAGRYDFCFQVWTTNTQNPQLVSNPNGGCAFAFLVLNDPPILIKPQRGDQIVLKDPLNIFFNWQSRSTTATNLSYEFEIRELWDDQLDPQTAFLASLPLYRETTRANAFLYDNTKPALLPDKTYAWRVRAISTSGIDENAVYKNNGYSEIFHFRLTKDCDAPKFPLSEAISKSTVKINWQGNLEHNKYHVQYRKVSYTQETDKQRARREKKNKKRAKKGQKEKDYVPKKEDHDWFEVYTFNEQAQISNLEAGVTYEFRVGGTCSSLASLNHYYSYTSENQFTMPTDEETVSYNCGVVPDIQITNQTPLQNLGVNETFYAGDFPVTVKEIQNNGGRFSGNGFITVPYLADTKIAVAFEGITINTEYQLIDGVVQTTYDPTFENVVSIDGFIDEIGNLLDSLSDLFDDIEDNRDDFTYEEWEEIDEQVTDVFDAAENEINQLVTDGIITQEEADELLNNLEEAENNYEKGGSECEGQGSGCNESINESENGFKSVAYAINAITGDDALFRLVKAVKQFDGQSFIKCKECSDINSENAQEIDGNSNFSYVFSNRKYYKCIIGYLSENGIETEKFSYEQGSENNDISNEIKKIASDYKDILIAKEATLAIFNGQEAIEFSNDLIFISGYCDSTDVTEQEKEDIINEINACASSSTNIANTVTFTDDNGAVDFESLKSAIEQQLGNDFFQEVKIAINLKQGSNTETLLSKGLSNASNAEITLNAEIVNNQVNISTLISENYLQDKVAVLQQLADSRGIDVDTEELRQLVLLDLQDAVTVNWFANLSQELKALLNDQIGTFIEALQASQKIVKNVWSEGKMPNSTWHSVEPDHTKWPVYTQFPDLVAGGSDGVIEEVTGIPQAIKGIYGIMTDPEQKEAFMQIFTADGMSALIDGLKQVLQDTWDDDEKLVYSSTKTTVSVAAAVFGVGIITKGGKVAQTLETLVEKINDFTGLPKLTRFLEDVKKQDWYSEAFKQFRQQFDELIDSVPITPEQLEKIIDNSSINTLKNLIPKLHRLKDIEGLDKVIKDLAQHWKTLKGAKFVVDYCIQKGDNFIAEIRKFEDVVEITLSDGGTKLRRYDIALKDGTKLEFKDWSKWTNWSNSSFRNQFIPDIADLNFTKLGQKKYIFKANTNINASNLKQNVINSLKKADGSPVDALDDLFTQNPTTISQKFSLLFGKSINNSDDIINVLSDNTIFNKLFEVVE